MEGARHVPAGARSCKRSSAAVARGDACSSARRGLARLGPQRPGQDRRVDRGRAGADRAPPGVRLCVRPRQKGRANMTIDVEPFRTALLEERARVEKAIATLRASHPGSIDDEVEEFSGTSDNHIGDTATATLGREIDYTLGENAGQVLGESDAALRRIDEGTYGACVKGGKEIARGRLEAYPWASLCIDDARKAERG